jgi:hypothetical protein
MPCGTIDHQVQQSFILLEEVALLCHELNYPPRAYIIKAQDHAEHESGTEQRSFLGGIDWSEPYPEILIFPYEGIEL